MITKSKQPSRGEIFKMFGNGGGTHMGGLVNPLETMHILANNELFCINYNT